MTGCEYVRPRDGIQIRFILSGIFIIYVVFSLIIVHDYCSLTLKTMPIFLQREGITYLRIYQYFNYSTLYSDLNLFLIERYNPQNMRLFELWIP